MDVVRRFSLLATAGLLGIAVMLGWVSARPSMSPSSANQLAAATAYFDSTIVLARNAQPRGARGDALTVGLGYLERSRIGLGSPFRLADEALNDPRIDPWMSSRIAWALLGRLRRGEAYVIDPSVMDGSGPWSRAGHGATGSAHVALIERAIASAPDPRVGELTVRLAYNVASGKGTTSAASAGIASEVAALVRDRALAQADLRDLLSEASQRHEDVMTMLVARRADRSFRVERPPLAPLTSEQRIRAMNDVPALVAAIDTLDRVVVVARDSGASAPLLGGRFAGRLQAIGEKRPPIAQIVVSVRTQQRADLAATNEETLVAEWTRIALADDSTRRAPALALLASAVAMRGFAQETPWFVGDPGPEIADVAAEFGLGEISFARSVPAAWRPYYLRELRDGLRDMQGVFPALSLAGLNVAFGTADLPDSALAMHNPRTRTLQLNVAASSGTLAHELAHDLDWQTSRRMFAVAGGYSTDRAMREQRGALATSVRGLAEARSMRPMQSATATAQLPDRPAELFARGADWFTASTLAQRGRTNGFLTAVQDATLPGYAAGAPTAIGVAGASSLVNAIDQMTFVPDSVQIAFKALWADASVIDPVLLVRRVLATPPGRMAYAPRNSPAALLPPARSSLCSTDASPEGRAREQLLMLAVDARANGIAVRRARYRFGGMRVEWANGILGTPPWDTRPSETMIALLRGAIIGELRASSADQGVVPAVPASFRSNAASCSVIAR